MALVKYGGGIIQMSGSIAGTTHARNRYGNYARARTKPVNPNTTGQNNVRAAMTHAVEEWSDTLTVAQRTAWQLYADSVNMKNRLGETIHLSGFNHFVRSASLFIRNGNPYIADGPVIFELPGADVLFAFTGSEATQQLSVTFDNALPWANEIGGKMFMFMGMPKNAGINFFAGPWRYCHSLSGSDVAPPASPAVVNVPYAISEGQRLWLYARIIRADGRVSSRFQENTFCLA